LVGVILILIGAMALVYEGFSYNRQRELFRAGDVRVQIPRTERVRIPPWVGFALIGGGVVMLIVPRRNARS
ncbi:MAG: hypothetical protein ACK4UN_08560, partial [Limisphaerales bacterium]